MCQAAFVFVFVYRMRASLQAYCGYDLLLPTSKDTRRTTRAKLLKFFAMAMLRTAAKRAMGRVAACSSRAAPAVATGPAHPLPDWSSNRYTVMNYFRGTW